MGDELMKLDMTHAATHEIDIIGSFRYANTVRTPPPPPPSPPVRACALAFWPKSGQSPLTFPCACTL